MQKSTTLITDHIISAIRRVEQDGFNPSETRVDRLILFEGKIYPIIYTYALAARLAQVDINYAEIEQHLTSLGFVVVSKDKMPYIKGFQYTRRDIYNYLGIEKGGGDWDTGYHRHKNDWYIFCAIQSEGRTGHNYGNHWRGDKLYWRGKTGSHLKQGQIQSMLNPSGTIHVFHREGDRDPFTYAGQAVVDSYEDTTPVTIIWRFKEQALIAMSRPPHIIAEEIGGESFTEGAARTITVNAYERDPNARAECIRHYGTRCVVCSLDMAERYGEIGEGFIHVHHIVPLSQIGKAYKVNPIRDLRPVCPNCHAMLHRRQPPYSLDELKEVINNNSK